MPDQVFENPRLAAIYDHFDGKRTDLEHYLAIVRELKARSVLDIGCGTGSFATILAERGFEVTGVDPAQASIAIAQRKPFADMVRWVSGDISKISTNSADMAVMTGNVAQVFLTDEEWENTLQHTRSALNITGHLVFEVRDPAQKAWIGWNKEQTHKQLEIPEIGKVESWCEITEVSHPFISFRWTYVFASDQQVITSDSTLRFREKAEIEQSLVKNGYIVKDIRDAPDRPGKEFVFVARKF